MPYKSKSQWKWGFAAEKRGELKKGTARRWAHHTKRSFKKLPNYVSASKAQKAFRRPKKKKKKRK